jgi:hypothetical protein
MDKNKVHEPFLARWSRQKQQGQQAAARKAPVPAPGEPEPEVDLTKLPRIEDLTAETDITGFLQRGVPEALQKLALRKMWSLDPGIRDFIEVAENQWDFNAVGGVHGLFQEIEDGTDISVWMAQATQSVVGEQQKPREVAAVEESADGADKPENEIETAGEQAAGPLLSADPVSVATACSEPRPDTAGNTTPERKASVIPVRSRRRHGGALPV